MIGVQIIVPVYKISLHRSDAENFCRYVLRRYVEKQGFTSLLDCAAVNAYNKLRNKLANKKITLSLPMDQALLLKRYCQTMATDHDLERIALDSIFQNLDTINVVG